MGDRLSTLSHAVVHGDMTTLRDYLDHGGDPNLGEMATGTTLLHEAAYCRQVDIVRLLLAGGADPNRKDNMHQTPLDRALVAPVTGSVTVNTLSGLVVSALPGIAVGGEQRRATVSALLEAGVQVNPAAPAAPCSNGPRPPNPEPSPRPTPDPPRRGRNSRPKPDW